jgi:hypothetical protein
MELHDDTTAPVPPQPPDPFDVARLALPDDDADLGVREVLVTVPFRKPSKEQFFRVHTADHYRCVGGLVELKDDGDYYWVDRSLWQALDDEPTFSRRRVVTAVTRGGLVFLWGLRMPGPDGKVQDWMAIPQEAARIAAGKWTKLTWDQGQKRHRITVSEHVTDAPTWPDIQFPELLRLAFKDRTITSLDHPVLKKLRGEI